MLVSYTHILFLLFEMLLQEIFKRRIRVHVHKHMSTCIHIYRTYVPVRVADQGQLTNPTLVIHTYIHDTHTYLFHLLLRIILSCNPYYIVL